MEIHKHERKCNFSMQKECRVCFYGKTGEHNCIKVMAKNYQKLKKEFQTYQVEMEGQIEEFNRQIIMLKQRNNYIGSYKQGMQSKLQLQKSSIDNFGQCKHGYQQNQMSFQQKQAQVNSINYMQNRFYPGILNYYSNIGKYQNNYQNFMNEDGQNDKQF